EPYVELNRQMMRRFGVDVTADDGLYKTLGGQRYRATDTDVPGDFSSAAFPLVGSAITDGDVTVTGLDVDGPLGDRKIIEILRSFGASVEVSGDRVRVRGGPLVAQTVDIGDTPDLFPILAVLASQAQGETRFVNGRHLRFKESDRIESTVSMLLGLGGRAKPTDDGCIVVGPTRLLGGSVEARGDHRILMAAGTPVDERFVQGHLDRRRPGQSLLVSQRKESDRVEFSGGLLDGAATGEPIVALLRNEDVRSESYAQVGRIPRPGHGDFAAIMKY